MTLLPYDLSFIHPIYLFGQKIESKNGLIIKIEVDNITSFADVSPLQYLNFETFDDVYEQCKKIDTKLIFHDIETDLKTKKETFLREKFLDFDFSKYTSYPSLQSGLSNLFSYYFRQKFNIQIIGDVYFHGLVPNHLTHSSEEDVIKRVLILEKNGFSKIKIKIGSKENSDESLKKENLLLKKILSQTKILKLRLDANQKFRLSDFDILLEGLDLDRIEYVEEPVAKISELIHFTKQTKLSIAIDESIHLMKDIVLDKVSTVIIKPTLLGDYHNLKKIINMYAKRGISTVFSSCFESQLGIYQLAQLAYVFNPTESHGLDTFDCYLEKLMELKLYKNAIILGDDIELKGPLYI